MHSSRNYFSTKEKYFHHRLPSQNTQKSLSGWFWGVLPYREKPGLPLDELTPMLVPRKQ
jgi:hypothetical protein